MLTASFDVRGSYPEPPDAKQTPVMRSLGCKFGSKYAGRSSLRPNISTMYRNKKKKEVNCEEFFRSEKSQWIISVKILQLSSFLFFNLM
jgi:hypothetical protein